MPMPVLNPVAERIYEEIRPIAYNDAVYDYFLAHMVEAWTRPFLIVEEIVRDTDDGPGWSSIMHPDTAPAMFLDWLSVVLGSIPRPGETEEQARQRLRGMEHLRRGSAAAMRSAATRYLDTGDPDVEPYVIFNERVGGNAWQLAVRTLASQTPDEDQVRAALMEQKPIGIVLTYEAVTDPDYDTVEAAYDDYAEVLASYPTYGHMVVDLPA